MRTAFILLVACLASLPALLPGSAATTPHLVDVVNNAYRDSASGNAVTTVAVGTTVTWIWRAGLHTVTEGIHPALPGGGFDSGLIDITDEDPTFSHTFDAAGEYVYYCARHIAMRGVVVVE